MRSSIKIPSLPFLTREMLKFGSTTPIQLRINVASADTQDISIRGFTRSGPIDITFVTAGTGVIEEKIIGLPDFPIMVSIVDEANALMQGQVWASIELLLFGEEYINLGSGYVYKDKGITWPATTSQDKIPGRGYFTNVNSANPAAGDEIAITVPAGEMWLVHYGQVTLVSDATVTNRRPVFTFTGPSGEAVVAAASFDHAASKTRIYTFSKIGDPTSISYGNHLTVAIPHDLWIGAGGTITTATANIQAADDYGVMKVLVEKFIGME